MENILLTINIILAIILVILVLFQKSEGGALGIGVSQESYMFSKTAGNFLKVSLNKKKKIFHCNSLLNFPAPQLRYHL